MEEIAADLQKMDSSTTVGGGCSVFNKILTKISTKQKMNKKTPWYILYTSFIIFAAC